MAYDKCTEQKSDTDTWLRESFKQEEEEDGNVDMKEETKKIIGNTESPEVGKQYMPVIVQFLILTDSSIFYI